MLIQVKRFQFLEKCTIGHLLIDGQDTGIFTLEDKVREQPGVPVERWKVPNETAIPAGTYKVVIDFSPHFKKELPHLLDVPGYTGVRIHSGNESSQTEGCLLVGKVWKGGDFIGESRDAFNEIFPKLQAETEIQLQIG